MFTRGTLIGIAVALALVVGRCAAGPRSAIASGVPGAKPSGSPVAPKRVDVEPAVRDDQIAHRLQEILVATGWFEEPTVRVHDGVVFLEGTAANVDYKDWASDLVRNTQDVVAVVNKMQVSYPEVLDLKPAVGALRELWRGFLQNLPFLGIGMVILVATLLAVRAALHTTDRLLQRRVTIPLIREVIARCAAGFVFLVGLYVVLKVSGTTQLALTVLGGTGLFGLALGIAFRDITENFLASIFLSIQRPFQIGDLIEIVDVTGYVNRLTVRTTIIVSLDGNYVQIPNATVYKNTIRNFTNNPKRRDDFAVFIAYGKSISQVQEAALRVLREHPAVLKQPDPWVLVDHLNQNGIEMRIYYWIDCIKNDWLTVRSSVIRLVLHALREKNLIILAGPNEIIFPKGLAVHLIEQEKGQHRDGTPGNPPPADSPTPPASTSAEGRLRSPRSQLKQQVDEARPLEVGPDLLKQSKDGARLSG